MSGSDGTQAPKKQALPIVGATVSPRGTDGTVPPSTAVGPERRDLPLLDPHAEGRPLDRREVLKLMVLAAAVPGLASCEPGDGVPGGGAASGGSAGAAGTRSAAASNPAARGDAWDPDLIRPVLRWDKVLSEDEREGLAVLCDVIIPADDVSPSASSVGAHDYIDEWVSAPYDFGRQDLILVRGGLVWLDQEAASRFGAGRRFRDLTAEQRHQICDDICWLEQAAPEYRRAARFFAKIRDLTATAFYTTPEGMDDLGYVGNVALAEWGPPPPEVLRHLGLEAPGA